MYTYSRLNDDISFLLRCGAEAGSIGYSESGRIIPYVRIGCRNGIKTIVTGGIHARENVACALVMRQAAYALSKGVKNGSVYFVPMLNPDGALLIEHGSDFFGKERSAFLKKINGGSENFSLWKANLNAVDLNVNFDARWSSGSKNVFTPAPENYVGGFPFCARETAALRDFTLEIMPDCTVSYHAKGRELYWYFHQNGRRKTRDENMARFLNEKLLYEIKGDFTLSAGGYKDWCVEKLKIPAFTVEIVSDEKTHPLSDDALDDDEWERNKDLPLRVNEYLARTHK